MTTNATTVDKETESQIRLQVYFRLLLVAAAIVVATLTGGAAHAQFSVLETEDMRLVYFTGLHSYLVPHVAGCFENSMSFHKQLWDYEPSEKVTVFVHDFGDYGNGGASSSPRNTISLGIAPLNYVYETAPANERVNSTMNHEVMHLVALDKATGRDRFFRFLFRGKVRKSSAHPESMLYSYLTSPRRSAPRWFHEGIAVFFETWMCGGYGRTQGAWDEMVFRTMVRDSLRIYDRLGLESEGTKVDFQVGVNSYLYGARFFAYLAYHYGPEKLIEWVSRTKGSSTYFSAQFKRAFGLSLDSAWRSWIEWERSFQASNLEQLRQYPMTPLRDLSTKALGSVSKAFIDSRSGDLITAVNYPGQVAHIVSIDTSNGSMRKLREVKGAALYFVSSLALDSSSGTLFYTTDNNDWRDLAAVNLQTGKSRTLMKNERVGDLSFNQQDSSLWGVRHFNGISALVRIPHPYTEWNLVYSWPYGKDIYDIDISPDGRLLSAALAEVSGRQTLILMEVASLLDEDTTYTTVFDFGNSLPANFTFSPDSRYLFGSSYRTGVSNIHRYDLVLDSMEVLSNCETGLFRPLPVSDDSLIAFRYTGSGFVPVKMGITPLEDVNAIKYLGYEITQAHPVVMDWMVGSPAAINVDSMTVYSGPYRSLQNVRLATVYPIIEGYRDHEAWGACFNFSDPVGFHNSRLAVTYSPGDALLPEERWHLDWEHTYMDWTVRARYNDADFYDLFGPTKSARKGYSAGLEFNRPLIYDLPKRLDLKIHATAYGDLERLPEYQNVATSYDKFWTFGWSLSYRYMRASLGAVDYEKGYRWRLVSSNRYVNEKLYPRIIGNLDLGIALPIGHSSLWLRNSAGYAYGDRYEPFANFFFGGFGNNWVDNASVRRFRQYYSFPGVELNEIGGTTFGKTMVELDLPPLRFRHLGVPTFYGTWARLALFASTVATNPDDRPSRDLYYNLGAQLDLRIVMMSHLNLTLSCGYAHAFTEGSRPMDELMFSVKIL